MSFRFTRLVLFFALSNFIICNCWAKPECTRVSLTPSSMADSFSKDVSADFLHSSHRRFSRQDCRKASQTIHTSAIRQSLYTSLVALVWGQRVKQFWLTKKTADRLFIPFNNKGKKTSCCFDWWIIDKLVNNDNNSTKLVKCSHLVCSTNNQLCEPIHIAMNQQQNIGQNNKHKPQINIRQLETKWNCVNFALRVVLLSLRLYIA